MCIPKPVTVCIKTFVITPEVAYVTGESRVVVLVGQWLCGVPEVGRISRISVRCIAYEVVASNDIVIGFVQQNAVPQVTHDSIACNDVIARIGCDDNPPIIVTFCVARNGVAVGIKENYAAFVVAGCAV